MFFLDIVESLVQNMDNQWDLFIFILMPFEIVLVTLLMGVTVLFNRRYNHCRHTQTFREPKQVNKCNITKVKVNRRIHIVVLPRHFMDKYSKSSQIRAKVNLVKNDQHIYEITGHFPVGENGTLIKQAFALQKW
jgi:hypothetical protein